MEKYKSRNILSLFIILLLSIISSPIWGQVDFADEKNKITEVKRNPAYVYGEGIAETAEEALEIAEGSLKSEILRVISENESLQNTHIFEVGTVRQNSEKVALKRGTLERVFLYVAKDCIQPGHNGITINFRKEEPMPVNQSQQQAAPVKEEPKESEPEKEPVVENIEVIKEEPIQEEETTELFGLTEPEEIQTGVSGNTVVEITSPLLRKIVAIHTMTDMEKLFRTAKDERLLMWGNVSSSINPSWYLLVYDKEGVKAILDKGTAERLNYLTGEVEEVASYQNDPKIWFILYE